MSEKPKNPPGSATYNMGRPVIYTDTDYQTKQRRSRPATFHVWGYNRQGGKDRPPVMETVAIIELEDGRIKRAYPDQIRFTDTGNDKRD